MAALIRFALSKIFHTAPVIEDDPDFDRELYEKFRHVLFDVAEAIPKKS